ncbi:MAG: nicotinate-nicotinamide nucleotide adenylyltransferase [bacterium]|nr:nicotinate-nicotinamide nucleotide adenylyltransferase [bacterium]
MPTTSTELHALQNLMDGLDPSAPPQAYLVKKAEEGILQPGKSLLVLDASFNPMTLAHEKMTDLATPRIGAHETQFMLSRANVDKQVFGAALGQRLAMLQFYAADKPHVSIAACSHARFVDKVQALIPLYPQQTQICFLIGYDTLERLFDQKYYQNMQQDLEWLFARARFVCANRNSNDLEAMQSFMKAPQCLPFADQVDFIHLPAPYAQISSTQARTRLENAESVHDLVPPKIEQAIQSLNLYRS